MSQPFTKSDSTQSVVFHTSFNLQTFKLDDGAYTNEAHKIEVGKKYKVIGAHIHASPMIPKRTPMGQAVDKQGNPVFEKDPAYGATDIFLEADENTGVVVSTLVIREGFASLKNEEAW